MKLSAVPSGVKFVLIGPEPSPIFAVRNDDGYGVAILGTCGTRVKEKSDDPRLNNPSAEVQAIDINAQYDD